MKIKSVEISKLHNVKYAKYDFADLTYFYGCNGAGKSTILNAVQLAILGYIPGTAKTNAAIMKHAQGSPMTVELVLTDGNRDYKISRTWTRKGMSVSATVDVVPEDFDISQVIQDVELPIFNFNEFATMPSNKLKDWFIAMLPSQAFSFDMGHELQEAIKDIDDILDKDYVDATYASILAEVLPTGDSITMLRNLTERLKGELSVKRADFNRVQSSIENLVYHETDDTRSLEDVEQEYKDLEVQYNNQLSEIENAKHVVALHEQLNALGTDDDEASFDVIEAELKTKELKSTELKTAIATKVQEVAKAESAYLQNHSVATSKSLCLVTKEECEHAASAIADAIARDAELQAAWDSAKAEQTSLSKEQAELEATIHQLQSRRLKLVANLESRTKLRAELLKPNMIPLELAQLAIQQGPEKLSKLQEAKLKMQDIISTLKANKKYDEFIDMLVAQKFALEQDQEILKRWIKLCDVNGLQTRITADAFAHFSKNITEHLQALFNDEAARGEFNLSEKANSFSFGMIRNEAYVEYEALSSGEKCLYALALMLTILTATDTALPLILIDDMLDHLDGVKAAALFNSLYCISQNSKIQLILAGVQTCNHEMKDVFVKEVI